MRFLVVRFLIESFYWDFLGALLDSYEFLRGPVSSAELSRCLVNTVYR